MRKHLVAAPLPRRKFPRLIRNLPLDNLRVCFPAIGNELVYGAVSDTTAAIQFIEVMEV